MIPAEIKAEVQLFSAMITDWRLEILGTNWPGYWIVQLTRVSHPHFAMLIDLNCLKGILKGFRSGIDTALNPANFPRARSMLITLADGVSTQQSERGGMNAVFHWEEEEDPYVVLTYHRGNGTEPIRQGLKLEGAMHLHDFLLSLFNEVPNREEWSPRISKNG